MFARRIVFLGQSIGVRNVNSRDPERRSQKLSAIGPSLPFCMPLFTRLSLRVGVAPRTDSLTRN